MVTATLQSALGSTALADSIGQLAVGTPLQFRVGATFFIAFGVLFLGTLAVQLLLVWWTYTDAKSNNVDSPELWAGVVFLAPLLGLLIYLLVARDDQSI